MNLRLIRMRLCAVITKGAAPIPDLEDLKKNQVSVAPFIKTRAWKYYHDNGKMWKEVFFKWELVPIELSESIDASTESRMLPIRIPEPFDEYITG
jgi:hypothetical protein